MQYKYNTNIIQTQLLHWAPEKTEKRQERKVCVLLLHCSAGYKVLPLLHLAPEKAENRQETRKT